MRGDRAGYPLQTSSTSCQDWDWEGRRVLDFGCGAGRALRHLLPEAREGTGEFWGSDIDAPSIAWLQANLCPSLHSQANQQAPPLEVPSDYFDVIYPVSVFTHITEEWSSWLIELHRVLKPDGLIAPSFLGEGMSNAAHRSPGARTASA